MINKEITIDVYNDLADQMYKLFYDKMYNLIDDCGIIVKKDINHFLFDVEKEVKTVNYRSYNDYCLGLVVQKWLRELKSDDNFEVITKSEFIKKFKYDPFPDLGASGHLIICKGFERKLKIKKLLE